MSLSNRSKLIPILAGLGMLASTGILGTYLVKDSIDLAKDIKKSKEILNSIETQMVVEATHRASITPTVTFTPTASYTPTATPTATGIPIGPDNNPLVKFDYSPDDSPFDTYLEDKLTNLRGTVIESYLDQMSVWVGYEGGGSSPRTFSWLVLREDKDSSVVYYMIYPADRVFPKGTRVNIQEYWTLKPDTDLSNHALVLLTNPDNPRDIINYYHDLNFLIESGAPDGLVDGIIPLGKVEYVGPMEGLNPTPTPTQTPTTSSEGGD